MIAFELMFMSSDECYWEIMEGKAAWGAKLYNEGNANPDTCRELCLAKKTEDPPCMSLDWK